MLPENMLKVLWPRVLAPEPFGGLFITSALTKRTGHKTVESFSILEDHTSVAYDKYI